MDHDTGFTIEKSLSMDDVLVIALIFTGIKMEIIATHVPDVAGNPLLKLFKLLMRHRRLIDGLRGNAFRVRRTDPATGKPGRSATPLALALDAQRAPGSHRPTRRKGADGHDGPGPPNCGSVVARMAFPLTGMNR